MPPPSPVHATRKLYRFTTQRLLQFGVLGRSTGRADQRCRPRSRARGLASDSASAGACSGRMPSLLLEPDQYHPHRSSARTHRDTLVARLLDPRLDRKTVLLVGHFSPPLHGMAVAMDAMAEFLATQGRVVRVRTVPFRSLPRALHHFSRVLRVCVASVRLLTMRRWARAVVVSVDAGHGMLYTVLLAWLARQLRYWVVLDHHSYAYVAKPSTTMMRLVAVAGPRALHLFKCQTVRHEFDCAYQTQASSRVLSGAYALRLPHSLRERDSAAEHPLRLAHLSNLSMEKGLDEVLRFGREATRLGLADKVTLAGPTSGARERGLVEQAVVAGYAEYLGPLASNEKDLFFRQADVFLFPSLYRNELAPYVVWEALLNGVPVITYRVGCLTQESLGGGSFVIDPGQDYLRIGLRQLATWAKSPSTMERARADAIRTATAQRVQAVNDVRGLGKELFGRGA